MLSKQEEEDIKRADSSMSDQELKVLLPKGIELDWENRLLVGRLKQAVTHPLKDSLFKCLDSMTYNHRADPTYTTRLFWDFAPLSFGWAYLREGKAWMSGGLILHSSQDCCGGGGAPTFSVSLDRSEGWQQHS